MNQIKYLVSNSNLFFTDEHYKNTNSGGDKPLSLFSSLEEAKAEKKKLELIKIRDILSNEPLSVACQYWQNVIYIENEDELMTSIKKELQLENIDISNDETLEKFLLALDNKFGATRVDFYFITEMKLEE